MKTRLVIKNFSHLSLVFYIYTTPISKCKPTNDNWRCVITDDNSKKVGQNRLDQLKKWKEERERRRKQENMSKRSNPVFRVSKAVEHADTGLFQHSKQKVCLVYTDSALFCVNTPNKQHVPFSLFRPSNRVLFK